eukprot:7132019-Prymnesium_polylepis.1
MILSALGLSLPMGLVQRAGTERGRGRRGEWGVRPAIFAAATCTHETGATEHGHTVMLSTGWEESVARMLGTRERWGV